MMGVYYGGLSRFAAADTITRRSQKVLRRYLLHKLIHTSNHGTAVWSSLREECHTVIRFQPLGFRG